MAIYVHYIKALEDLYKMDKDIEDDNNYNDKRCMPTSGTFRLIPTRDKVKDHGVISPKVIWNGKSRPLTCSGVL